MSELSKSQRRALTELREVTTAVELKRVRTWMSSGFMAGRSKNWEDLQDAVLLFGPLALDRGRTLHHYRDGVWIPGGDLEVRRRVVGLLGQAAIDRPTKEILSRLAVDKPRIDGVGPARYINFRNGMLDLRDGVLHDHDPKHYSTVQLTVGWNPDATCPGFEHWLNTTIDPEVHDVLMQVIGATIYTGMPFQRVVALIGPGYNGKGTLERVIRALLPSGAVSSISLSDLAMHQFFRADLYGKTANLCGDIERFGVSGTAMIKMLTGQDRITTEKKYAHPFAFTSQAQLVFSGNAMPPSSDGSYGWHRRWLIVPMLRQIEGPPDRGLEEALTQEQELEGIALLAVRAIQRALVHGDFIEPVVCVRAQEEYRRACDSVVAFIESELTFGASTPTGEPAVITRSELYDRYMKYCLDEDVVPKSRPALYDGLRKTGRSQVKEVKPGAGTRERVFEGVAFRDPAFPALSSSRL